MERSWGLWRLFVGLAVVLWASVFGNAFLSGWEMSHQLLAAFVLNVLALSLWRYLLGRQGTRQSWRDGQS
ncbi:hypothetical protein [Micromonospora sp. NBC_01638]|uniref:hypothetical protein n=1 Tax=Micromonospora sp. NBC_01638 TaxID=2975982 RepID=UPI00386CB3E6|nr:hypothetical protein OG811_22625 [Micromonospora sp. NBC_01638]